MRHVTLRPVLLCLLLSGVVVGACDNATVGQVEDTPTPTATPGTTPTPDSAATPTSSPTPGPTAVPSPTEPPATLTPEPQPPSLNASDAPAEVLRIREIYRALQTIDVDEFGRQHTIAGYFLEGDSLNVYLRRDADPEAVQAQIEATLAETLPPGGIRLVQPGDFGAEQLDSWLTEVHRVVNSDERINLQGITGRPRNGICCIGADHIGVDVGTAYSSHLIREALKKASVPQEAVAIGIASSPEMQEPSTWKQKIGATLEFEPVARQGGALRIELIWTNISGSTVNYIYSPGVPANIVAFTPDGEEVWASFNGAGIPSLGEEVELEPGEEKRFTFDWELVDEDGFALPPGDYLLQAQTDVWQQPAYPDRWLVSETYAVKIEGG